MCFQMPFNCVFMYGLLILLVYCINIYYVALDHILRLFGLSRCFFSPSLIRANQCVFSFPIGIESSFCSLGFDFSVLRSANY